MWAGCRRHSQNSTWLCRLSVCAQFKRCENLPTKQQLQATIARLLKQPARKLAVGIKMVPTKLAYGIKALADLDEDKSKTVAEVAKPKTA